jgi:hypothetical protein
VSTPSDPGFLALATQRAVVRRALGFAVVVGSVLIAINHGDAILAGEVGSDRWLKMGLTVLVPYAVSTLSSVSAMRDRPEA